VVGRPTLPGSKQIPPPQAVENRGPSVGMTNQVARQVGWNRYLELCCEPECWAASVPCNCKVKFLPPT
jgi:hypothetical protein